MSERTFDKLYKFIEYMLVNEEVSADEVLRGVVDINAMAVTLNAWCLSNVREKVFNDICTKSFNMLDEALTSLANHTIIKHMDGKVRLGNDVLSRFLTIMMSFVEVIKKIVKDSLIVQEEKVLCKVKKPLAIFSDRVVEKGYIILIPLDLAIVLTVLGYVELIPTQVPLA